MGVLTVCLHLCATDGLSLRVFRVTSSVFGSLCFNLLFPLLEGQDRVWMASIVGGAWRLVLPHTPLIGGKLLRGKVNDQ